MGTWGPGNLDNDYAAEALSMRGQELVQGFLDRARRSESREADEWDYTTLFVELEILFALDERGLLRGPLPDPGDIQALSTDYLTGWDAMIDEVGPTEAHKVGRRRIIEQSFERLRQLCERYAAEAVAPFVEQRLVFISGPPGVGKSTILAHVAESLPSAAWLDGDDVWKIRPFRVDEGTKMQVEGNIAGVLRGHLRAGFETVLLGWVLHRGDLVARLSTLVGRSPDKVLGLVCRPEVLVARREGRGEHHHERALQRLEEVRETCPRSIDTSDLSVDDTVAAVRDALA